MTMPQESTPNPAALPATPTTLPQNPTPPPIDQSFAQKLNPADSLAAKPTPPVPNPTSITPDKVMAANNADPKADPKTTVAAAATAASPADAALRQQIASSWQWAQNGKTLLEGFSTAAQNAIWERIPDSSKDLLETAGYQVPQKSAPHGGGGLFSEMWHQAANALDTFRHGGATVGHDVAKGAAVTGKTLLKGAEQVGNLGMSPIEHAVRAGVDLADANDYKYEEHQQSLWQDIGALVSPNQWARAWQQTKDGRTAFQPQVLAWGRKYSGLTPFQQRLAQAIASGENLQTILQKTPPAQRTQAVAVIPMPGQAQGAENPELIQKFNDYVKLLGDSHLSAGQAVFGGLSTKQEEQMGLGAHGLYHVAGEAEAAAGTAGLAALSGGTLAPALLGAGAAGMGAQAVYSAINPAVHEPIVSPFGLQIHPLSGILDGMIQWYASPFVWGTQAMTEAKVAMYAVRDAAGNARDLRGLFDASGLMGRGIRAGMQKIADILTSGPKGVANVDALMRTMPSLAPMSDLFVKAYPQIEADGARGVLEVFAEPQAAANLVAGKAGLYYHNATLIPHVGVLGRLSDRVGFATLLHHANGLDLSKMSLTQWLHKVDPTKDDAIADELADSNERNKGFQARFARRATTLTPMEDKIVFKDPDRGVTFQRFADLWLPRAMATRLVNEYMRIGPTEIGRQKAAITGLIDESLKQAGFESSTRGKEILSNFEKEAEDAIKGLQEHYSFGQNALYRNLQTGGFSEVALYPSQLADAAAIPTFRDLYPVAKKIKALEYLGGDFPGSHFLDTAMTYWKAAMLARPGFGVRFAMEELFSSILRTGFRPVAGRIALSTIPSATALDRATWLRALGKFNAAKDATEALKTLPEGTDADKLIADAKEALLAENKQATDLQVADKVKVAMLKRVAAGQKEFFGLSRVGQSEMNLLTNRMWAAMTSHIPTALRKGMMEWTLPELKAHILAQDAIQSGLRIALPTDIYDGTKYLVDRGLYDSHFNNFIDTHTQHMGAYVDDESGNAASFGKDENVESISWRASNKMQRIGPTDPDAYKAWHWALSGRAGDDFAYVKGGGQGTSDGIGRIIARSYDDGEAAQVEAAKEWAHLTPMQKDFIALSQLPDGSSVISGATSLDEAIDAWARATVRDLNHHVNTPDGLAIKMPMSFDEHDLAVAGERLVDMVARGEVPDTAVLQQIAERDLPDELWAPKLIPVVRHVHIDNFMRQAVARPANWISRQPIWLSMFAKAFKEAKEYHLANDIPDVDDEAAGLIAQERAWREVMPYIHNPRVRSQLSIMTRNIAPFEFAQEQFLKRWARTFATYPQAYRKAQLLVNGLRASGFVTTDNYGQASFNYPASGFVADVLNYVFGGGASPAGISFSSELGQLNPSLVGGGQAAITPNLGPGATFPLTFISAFVPSLSGLTKFAEGPEAPTQEFTDNRIVNLLQAGMDQILPTVGNRILEAIQAGTEPNDPNYSSMLMSSIVAAAQLLESQGLGPKASAEQDVGGSQLGNDPTDDVFYARLKNWGLNLLIIRALFGFVAPGTPSITVQGSKMAAEFYAMSSVMTYDNAVAAFMKKYPNATAYTIALSSTSGPGQSGAYTPETAAALKMIDDNKAFFTKYEAAAPWLFTTADGKGAFVDGARTTELALGLRDRRDLPQWWTAVRYAEGGNVYFPMEASKIALLNDIKNGIKPGAGAYAAVLALATTSGYRSGGLTTQNVTGWWNEWSAGFKKSHPVFAAYNTEEIGKTRRADVITQMQEALNDNLLPDTTLGKQMKFLMANYQELQENYNNATAQGAASSYDTEYGKARKDRFLAWGDNLVKTKGWTDLGSFWRNVLSKQIPG